MSALAETTLIAHLSDRDSMAVIAAEDIPIEAIPTEALRPVYAFALEYFHNCGRTMAPSADLLDQQFHSLVVEHQLVFGDPSDSIEWALADLRGAYAHRRGQDFTMDMARSMAEAASTGDVATVTGVIHEQAANLVGLSLALEAGDTTVAMKDAFRQLMPRYRARADSTTVSAGIGFGYGMAAIDEHTHRIHPGELAIMAGGAKTGKSWMMDFVALREWQAGRVPVLFTLENSVEMTIDRLACLATGISGRDFERGRSSEAEVEVVEKWVVQALDHHIDGWVLQPRPGQRTPAHLIRKAMSLGADSVLIDQLSHVEHPDPGHKKPNVIFREVMVDLREQINSSRVKLPCLVAHQINRDGLREAARTGHLQMWHLAESADIERTCDFAFSLYQSPDARMANQMLFQILAARRCDVAAWLLQWVIDCGTISVTAPTALDG